jgi:hypothetical protein
MDETAIHFICAGDGCWLGAGRSKTNVRCPRNVTSNAATHLKRCHGVESKKTRGSITKASVASMAVEETRGAYERDPVAFIQNAMNLWATEHSVQIAALQSPFLSQVLERMPGVSRNVLNVTDCRKLLFQQYLAVKRKIKLELRAAKLFFGDMPFVCVNLDLYQDPRQNKKYMAIRISWVDTVAAKLLSRLIGACHYNPTYQERCASKASAILAKWYRSVMTEDYDITDDMVLGGTGDHGSDVKKVMREHCGTHGFQEWCISHMLNCAFVEAFGVSVDKVRTTDWLLLTLYTLYCIVSHSPCNLSRRRARTPKHARSLQRCERRSSRSVSRPTCDPSLKRSRNSRDQIGKLSRLAIHPCIVGDQRRLRS